MTGPKKHIALSILLAFILQQSAGIVPAAALVISDNQSRDVMPEPAGTQQTSVGVVDHNNVVMDLAAGLLQTAFTMITGSLPPYMKTIVFTASPDSPRAGTISLDLSTNSITFSKTDGTSYSGTYDAATKKATLKSVDAAHPVDLAMQFAVKAGDTSQYPDLILSSMQSKDGIIVKAYSFSDDGQLSAYSAQRLASPITEGIGLNRLDNGRWSVSGQVNDATDSSMTFYSGFAGSADLKDFDQKDMNAQMSLMQTLTSTKAYCRWQGDSLIVLSYKEAGQFKDRVVARNTSAGFKIYLVIGQGDYKSTETDDLFVSNVFPTFAGLAGYTLSFGELVEQNYSKGYGLIFTSPTGIKSFVNFPTDDLFTVNVSGQNKSFQVYVASDGLIQIKDVTTLLSNMQNEMTTKIASATTETARLTDLLNAMDATLLTMTQTGASSTLTKDIEDLAAQIIALNPSQQVLDTLSNLKALALASASASVAASAQTLRTQLAALKQELTDNLSAMKNLRDKINASNNYKIRNDFLTTFRNNAAKVLTATTGELQKKVSDFLTSANALINQSSLNSTQYTSYKTQISDLLQQVNSDIAAKKTQVNDLFTSITQRKSTWDASAVTLDSLLTGMNPASLGTQLANLFVSANQIKISTEDRDVLDLVSLWTSQAAQSTAGLNQSDIDALKTELGKLKTSSLSFYTLAQSQKTAGQTSTNYMVLSTIVTTLQNLLLNYDSVATGSLFVQLQPLQSSASLIKGQLQTAASTLTSLQTKMTQAFQALTIPEKDKINTAGWEDSVFVTPDGKTMYFMYTPNNFYDFLVSQGKDPILYLGPARDGHHDNTTNAFEDSDLYVSHFVDGKWTAPVNMGINTNTSESCAMVSPDGNRIYLSKPVVKDSDKMDLFVSVKKADGTWGPLQLMGVPKLANEYAKSNPHISDDGKTVYFTAFFDVSGKHTGDLYYSKMQANGTWGVPVSMGPQINDSTIDEDQIWVSSDQNSIYFNRGMDLYSSKKVSGVWQTATKLDFGGTQVIGGEMSLTADGKQLFFSMVDPAIKDITVVTSLLQADGRWSTPVSVDELYKIPTSSLPAGQSFDSTAYVDLNAPTTSFNKMILGSNTQWTDNGDEMMIPGTLSFDPDMLAKAKAMAPTVLRYPGGDLSDYYNWRNGVGTLTFRNTKASQNFRAQPILFGTDEMLKLCSELNAEPIFTVNIMTMTAQDAADWVRYTNIQSIGKLYNGKPMPKVKYWEIGNEPYLNPNITPEQYAAKVDAFIAAMKAVDPTIQFGVAMRTSTLGPSDFNDRFLAANTQKFDYVTVHNSYFPLSFFGSPTEKEMYEAAMAASDVIKQDFVYFDNLLKNARPTQTIPVAVTEFNAIFSIAASTVDSSKTPTFASAMYVADLLMTFAETPNLMMANFWSLTGNGDFGAVSNTGETRPVYEVFTAYADIMKGELVSLDVKTLTFDNAAVGLVFSNQSADAVETLATLEGSTLRVLALNKDLDNPSSFRLMLPAGKTIVSVRVKKISDDALFDGTSDAQWVDVTCSVNGDYLDLNLDPHSISYLEIQIK